MNLSETYKLKAAVLSFAGDALRIIQEISIGADFCQDGEKISSEVTARIKAIRKFCNEVENRLINLTAETEYSLNDETIQNEFISQVKAIKTLCERTLKKS